MCAVDVSPVISTERLILRGPMVTDAPAIAEIAGDYNVSAMTTSMPHPYGLGDAEDWIEKCRHLDWRREAMFVVEHRAFGVVGLMGIDASAVRGPRSATAWAARSGTAATTQRTSARARSG